MTSPDLSILYETSVTHTVGQTVHPNVTKPSGPIYCHNLTSLFELKFRRTCNRGRREVKASDLQYIRMRVHVKYIQAPRLESTSVPGVLIEMDQPHPLMRRGSATTTPALDMRTSMSAATSLLNLRWKAFDVLKGRKRHDPSARGK